MLSSMKAFVAQACVAACLATAGATVAPSTSSAQDQEAGDVRVDLPPRRKLAEPEPVRTRTVHTPGRLRIYGGFSLAVGGDLQNTDANVGGFGVGGFNNSLSLNPTVGLQGGADYILHDYFSIGGETRFLWFKVDGASDRDFLWDIDIKPRGRYAFHNIPLEVYGALPIGLTVAGIKNAPEGKPGFNIGIVGGANYWFTSKLAINAEIGWVFHKFGVAYQGVEAHYKMNQFLLLCPNIVYSL